MEATTATESFILIILLVFSITSLVLGIKTWANKNREEKIGRTLEWLSQAVVLAEKYHGSKEGKRKLMFTYLAFSKRFPWISFFMSEKRFNRLVDKALDIAKDEIEDIKKERNK